jgi:hypothetical protein
MAIKAFNSIAGFSVGNIPANIILVLYRAIYFCKRTSD